MRVAHRTVVSSCAGRHSSPKFWLRAFEEQNMTRTVTLSATAATCIFGFTALAADLPKEGSYDYTSCYSGSLNPMSFSKTHSARTLEITGTIQSNPPGGLFDKVAYRCISLGYSAEGKTTATSVCEGVDKDGDKYLTHIVYDGATETRRIVDGTGKYEGMTATGTVESLGPFGALKPGTIQNCTRGKGTYKLK
jgi:FlaG/FlaF family flagellin (archaellin)